MVLPGVQQVQFFIYELSLPNLFAEPTIPFMCTCVVDVVQRMNSLAPSAPSTVCCGMEKPEVAEMRLSVSTSTPLPFCSL